MVATSTSQPAAGLDEERRRCVHRIEGAVEAHHAGPGTASSKTWSNTLSTPSSCTRPIGNPKKSVSHGRGVH